MEQALRKRLLLGHASIVLVIVLSTATALVALRSTIARTEHTSAIDQRIVLIDQFYGDARRILRSAQHVLLTGDQQRVLASFEDNLVRARVPLNLIFDDVISRERAKLDESQRVVREAQWFLVIAAVLGVLLTIRSMLAVGLLLRCHAERMRGAGAVAERAATQREDLLVASNELHGPLAKIVSQAAELRAKAR